MALACVLSSFEWHRQNLWPGGDLLSSVATGIRIRTSWICLTSFTHMQQYIYWVSVTHKTWLVLCKMLGVWIGSLPSGGLWCGQRRQVWKQRKPLWWLPCWARILFRLYYGHRREADIFYQGQEGRKRASQSRLTSWKARSVCQVDEKAQTFRSAKELQLVNHKLALATDACHLPLQGLMCCWSCWPPTPSEGVQCGEQYRGSLCSGKLAGQVFR